MSRIQLVTLLALGLIVLIIAGSPFWFPPLFAYIQKQDCIAAGYPSCAE